MPSVNLSKDWNDTEGNGGRPR
ncbi:hypothetical protein CBM2626_B160008 [Cupriavidus taiwanensis]|nr:hypothetical protein CBM2626_B160008 [Cupriavidus taiwanensis]